MLAVADLWIWMFWFLVAAYGIVLSAIFSGMETSVYMVNRVRLDLQVEAGRFRAKMARQLLNRNNDILGVLLIGNNIHNYLVTFAVSTLFVLSGYQNHTEWYAMIVTTPLLFVFSESLPKNLSQRMPEQFLYATVWVMRFFDLVFKMCGLTYLLRLFSSGLLFLLGRETPQPRNLLGHEALLAALAEGHAAGALTGAQREMADRVIHISQIRVAHVLQPMSRVMSVSVDVSREDFLQRISERNYSRLPMLDAQGCIAGVVDVYDVLADQAERPIHVYAVEPLIVPASLPVTRALYKMQHAKRSFAVVESGGKHIGIITIKDLVEEIVGELAAW